jgi:hypothetical protein
LGEPRAEYTKEKGTFTVGVTRFVGIILLILFLVIFGIFSVVSLIQSVSLGLLVSLLLLLMGTVVAFRVLRAYYAPMLERLQALVCTDGLVLIQGHQIFIFPWKQIVDFHEESESAPAGRGRIQMKYFVLSRSDGMKARFRADFLKGSQELFRTIQQARNSPSQENREEKRQK